MDCKASDRQGVTELLTRWRSGDNQARDELVNVAYAELRYLAARYMRRERAGHTLQATALVNELYIRLFGSKPIQWQDRAHFFAVAARQLRRILVNHARDRKAAKRGGKQVRLALSDVNGLAADNEESVMELDEAMHRLEELDSRAAQVVELRFFGGLTEVEAAEVLGVSVATLKRDWDFARAWLTKQLKDDLHGQAANADR
jgi:RNA polymerase sigma factor (TIGR02999 family)